jgi:hypothetical protein
LQKIGERFLRRARGQPGAVRTHNVDDERMKKRMEEQWRRDGIEQWKQW